ncbi:MAG TPA: hypothetical protein PL037_08425, partial [Elusimicrobiales bacterium]|nr:hypothetical protein [Elusimicrobiales bacterium]
MAQNPDTAAARAGFPLTFLLVAAFFVSPLLFFTDLTRNPYYLQFTILNIALLTAGVILLFPAVRSGVWPFPRSILCGPMAALLAAMALSFAHSYLGHAAFFRPSMLSEFTRAAAF